MSVKLGINGFGRIGRYLVRLLASDEQLVVTCINARAENRVLAHLLKYDSTHGIFQGSVSYDDDGLIINGRHVKVTRYPLGEWHWKELGIDLAVETSGKLKKRADLAAHLACGAKKCVISAPCGDADAVVVMGCNQEIYDPAKHDVISAASCTTNALAPAVKVINDNFGIVTGMMTTIHSYTMSQRILDGSNKDLRRARCAGVSMVPTTTGAAKATGIVIPALAGKLDGRAIRVPTPDVSMIDLTVELEKHATDEEVNAALKKASETVMLNNMGYSDEPLVSIDYKGDIHGGVIDAISTQVLNNNMLKLYIWYDNEAGFTNQLVRLLRLVGSSIEE